MNLNEPIGSNKMADFLGKLDLQNCPICDGKKFISLPVSLNDTHIQSYGGLYGGSKSSAWGACEVCGLVQQNPRPSIAQLNEYYKNASYHPENISEIDNEEYERQARWLYSAKIDFIFKNISKKSLQTVLEVGCGVGLALKEFLNRGLQVYGVEPDKNFAAYAARRIGANQIEHALVDEGSRFPIKFDLAFSNHVFEHISDLNTVLKVINNSISDSGYIFIAVPTLFKNYSSMSLLWMNSSHYWVFSHKSLAALLAKNGFRVISYTYHGSWKFSDELWVLAQKDPAAHKLVKSYYDNAVSVKRYVNWINPIRSFIFFPFFSHYAFRVSVVDRFFHRLHILFTNPAKFIEKIKSKLNF